MAGTGVFGFSGDGGPATSAKLTRLFGVALDASGNLFIGDFNNRRVRKVEGVGASSALNLVCELKVKELKETSERVADSMDFETFNDDPNLFGGDGIWFSLFGVVPETSVDDLLTLQGDHVVTWAAGTLTMGGDMKIRVKTDKKDPNFKEIKIEKAGKNDGITTIMPSTGGVNPNLADGGWHEVKIKNMDGVTVTFGSGPITGFLKELKVKLAQDSTTGSPIVREFKLKIKAETTIPDIKKGIVNSVRSMYLRPSSQPWPGPNTRRR